MYFASNVAKKSSRMQLGERDNTAAWNVRDCGKKHIAKHLI
ncbi:MAG: hypothetical protein Q8936_19545 [Bacillota bacterium]|nr:hypothetical protein [Bacillota bacterium]